jgi:phage recombination protein Bet
MASQQLITVDAPAEYTTAQVELIKKTVAAGCSNDELALFLEVCKGSGLNPFMKQIYAIKRGDKMTVQTGIDGYRLLAARTGDLAGIDDAVYDAESDERPAWASVTVWRFVRGQRVPFTAKARWREYAQVNRDGNPTAMWAKMPYLMLGKCAEALALRKAFPAELSGVYTAEEMDQADNPPTPYVEATPAPTPAPTPASAQAQAQAPAPPATDRAAVAMRNKDIMDLLVARQRFNDADRRLELEAVFAAIEAAGGVVNAKSVRAELQARLDDVTALSGLEMGAPGN